MPGDTSALRISQSAVLTFALAGCHGAAQTSMLPQSTDRPTNAVHRAASSSKVQHVVVIVQENRSFNNLFYGYPGAHTVSYGYDSHGDKVDLKPIGLDTTWDVDHSSASFFSACNGTGRYPGTDCQMNGFDKETLSCGGSGEPKCPIKYPPYAYVPHSETQPYFAMAKQYVLADEMFASNFDASSFVSHQYIIAAQASSSVDFPETDWGCEGGPLDLINTVSQERQIGDPVKTCFDNTTLGDELDDAGLSWGYYTSSLSGRGGIWSAYQAISHIYFGADWSKDVITPQKKFFDDVSNGRLRVVSWVTPTCRNSDHAGCGGKTGPSWVASLVNAIGQSKYWKSTVIFIFWDDYGGWYDPAAPTRVDYDGLGLRIPMLVISPYAKQDYVSHVHYEHGSILKFIEDQFGLPRLAASDARANSPEADAFNFNQAPRAFHAVPSGFSETYFSRQPLDPRIPDKE
jgi:phospholipase C